MLLPFVAIFLLILVILLATKIKEHVKSYQLLQKIPGPPSEGVIFGNVSYLQTTPEEVFLRLRELGKKFYPVYKLFALTQVGVNILSPEDAELILSNPVHNEKGIFYKVLHKWLKSGLLTSNGEKWRIRRKILTPAFHFNILEKFIAVFNEEAEGLVEVLNQENNQPYSNITPIIKQFALKVITETAMGVKLDFHEKNQLEYKNSINKISKILFYKIFHPWCIDEIGNLLNPWFFKEIRETKNVHKFTKGIIQEREKNFVSGKQDGVNTKKKRHAMLDLLLTVKREERSIDNDGIQEEVDTFMYAGHDTISTALTFTLMLLANNKDSQDRIFQEMTEVLGDIHKKPSYSDLQNFKYMEMCIKESLRLYPSVHFISRNIGDDLTLNSGLVVPKGSHVAIHIYDIHHNPEIYPDPEKFIPERFLPGESHKRHNFAYIPFSAGSRNCIGQKFAMVEMKIVLWAILSRFVLEAVDTPETVVLVVDLVLRTEEGIKIKFIER